MKNLECTLLLAQWWSLLYNSKYQQLNYFFFFPPFRRFWSCLLGKDVSESSSGSGCDGTDVIADGGSGWFSTLTTGSKKTVADVIPCGGSGIFSSIWTDWVGLGATLETTKSDVLLKTGKDGLFFLLLYRKCVRRSSIAVFLRFSSGFPRWSASCKTGE